MGLSNITPFRQLSRAYGALLIASNSLSALAQARSSEADLLRAAIDKRDLEQQLASLAAKIEVLAGAPGESDSLAASPTSQEHATLDQFSLMLHQCRSALMRDIPPNAERLISAGCSGRVYFDWIEKTYGYVKQHIGIEYYLPKPDVLPDNVTWIANTAGNMESIEDQSCDLMISGQNIEHLWPDEVVNFMLESARVLKPGGAICIDSPNRVLTALLNWSHPEHTIELTVPEIRRMLDLAGFEVTKEAGIWLCRDPKSGRILPIDPNTPDDEWSVAERNFSAVDKPEHSFLWWLEGRRTERRPDREGLATFVQTIFASAWPERIQRLIVGPGLSEDRRADGTWILVPEGHRGVVFFGPYMPLRSGRYRVTFTFETDVTASGSFARFDVATGPEAKVIAECEVRPGQTHATLEVEISALTFGGQFRCFGLGGAAFAVRRHVQLVETLNEMEPAMASQ